MKTIDKFLAKIGLVRKSRHEEILQSNHDFMLLLGEAAKKAGVNVVLSNERLDHCFFDADVFIVGCNNYIRNPTLRGGRIRFAPIATCNAIEGAFFEGGGE